MSEPPRDGGAAPTIDAGVTGIPWRRLLRYARPHVGAFAIAGVALVVGLVAGLLLPLVIGGLVGQVTDGDATGLTTDLLLLTGLALVLGIANLVQSRALGVIGERVVAQLRTELFGRLVSLELDFFVQRRVGELISRLTSDVTQVRTLLTTTITEILSSALGLAGAVVILLVLAPALLLLVLVLAPALLLVAVVASRPLRRLSMRVQDAVASSTTTAEEALAGIRVVKVFGREDWERRHYGAEVDSIVGTGIRLITWRAGFSAVMTFLGFGALAVILWYTGQQVIEGSLSLGALTAFLLYGATIGASLGSLASQYGRFQEGAGAIARVFELIDERPTIVDTPDAVPLPAVTGRISFEGVTFGYRPDRPVLRDIDLAIEPGEIIGIVGPSGSGKTTLCNLVPRLWDVAAGAIRVDGHDVRDVRLADLRQSIALVPQEAPVFGGTIRENILYGRLDATEEELVAAARAAHAHDFIVAMPDGYDTLLGDRGIRLSGGQRQRVALARAILKDAPILILDEATSSLDSAAERLVQEALDRVMRSRTTLVVAHRLSTIRHADRIAVLEDGWLLELGSHHELLARDGLYAHLWRLQAADREEAREDALATA
jgi:subfamily B ATP-binding cassette protein MsbA